MSGLSVALPLEFSEVFGPYVRNMTFNALAKQNLKMLLLTNPGERIMDVNFGAGIPRYLFENQGPDTYAAIAGKIRQQVEVYLPYLAIDDVVFNFVEDNPDLFPNSLNLSIYFTIIPLQQSDSLEIDIRN
jgi:phage baseplate assembly protein W